MDPKIGQEALALVHTEMTTMRNCGHQNVLKVIENGEGVYTKAKGSKNVNYIALELAETGELFDIVAMSGAFSERTARFYMNQFLDGLQSCHNQGIVHRDLKAENLLLDKDFNLKIADFGFANAIEGTDGDGKHRTVLGTLGYMAPEIQTVGLYDARATDLFAAAVCLFIMVAGHPPFQAAQKDDTYYKGIAKNSANSFWKIHSKNKEAGFFSDEFKDLLTAML